MKHITSSSALFAVIAGLTLTVTPALVVALLFESAAGAISAFITSMLLLTVCHDYAPRPASLSPATSRLHKYPLAA